MSGEPVSGPSDTAAADSAASEAPQCPASEPIDAVDVAGGMHQAARSDSEPIAMRRSDLMVSTGLAALVLILMGVKWVQLSGWGADTVEISELPPVANEFRLDVNTASELDWSQLDGIGEVMAARIVNDRETNGPFQSLDDLLRVDGIGPQTLERIRPWLTIKATD